MPFLLFLCCVGASLWLVQTLIVLPLELLFSLHLPFWLSLALGGVLFSWLFGE